jgi:hypothetical protein
VNFSKEEFPYDLLPQPIQDYLALYRSISESPDEYLVASALAIASALAGPHYTVNGNRLNNFYLLVGRTSIARKTTAVNFATELYLKCRAKRPDLTYQPPEEEKQKEKRQKAEAYPFVSSFSVEGLMEGLLTTGSSVLARMNEYGSLFQINKRQAQGNTITDLTDLYDCKPFGKRTVSKSFESSGYAITILASSTKEWIRELGSQHNTAGGFVNRHLIFQAEAERVIPFSEAVPEARLAPIVESLASIIPYGITASPLDGIVSWHAPPPKNILLDGGARLLWDKLYRAETKTLRSLQNERVAEIAGRELSHALKLAALRAVLSGRLVIEQEDLVFGARLARCSTQHALDLLQVEAHFDFGSLTKPAKKIIKLLREEEPRDKTEIAQSFGGQQDRVNAALDMLVRGDWLTKDEHKRFSLGPKFQVQDSEARESFGKSCIYDCLEKLNLETTSPGTERTAQSGTLVAEESPTASEAEKAWKAANGR